MQCDLCKCKVTGLRNAYLCYSTVHLLHNQLHGRITLIASTKAKYSCVELRACIGTKQVCIKTEIALWKSHVMCRRHQVMLVEVL
jgi:hypothetical protein